MRTVIIFLLLVALTGCETIPETVRADREAQRLAYVELLRESLRSRDETPVAQVAINLPPGTYQVPATGWELATVAVHSDPLALGLNVSENMNRIPIPENVAISALRAASPLIGGYILGHFSLETQKVNAESHRANMAAAVQIATQPPVIVEPLVVPLAAP